jgi:DNA-binding CsgD family transcriptional regulator/tetratricopeptide (TPR) repeat protein
VGTLQTGTSATSTVGAPDGFGLINRVSETATLEALLDAVRHGLSGALVLRGQAGIGKTALLERAICSAPDFLAVRALGMECEMELGFAGLHQLVLPFLPHLDRLPVPQRDALGAAFGLIAVPPPARFQVGLATLTLLANAASEQPLLCIIDDAQWLDMESSEVLAFVARRLIADRIALLFAVREPAERRTGLTGLPELWIDGLHARDARRLLATVVGGPLAGQVSERIIAETEGNPLAILELTTELTPRELGSASLLPEPLPIGSRLQQRFVAQMRGLPADTQTFLLLAAAESSGDPVVVWRAARQLGLEQDAVAAAEAARLLVVGRQILFRHPLIRSAIYHSASAAERRRIHAALAAASDATIHPSRHAWHRAYAAMEPDEEVAAELAQAGKHAQRRGSHATAAALYSRAAELTPDHGVRADRFVAAARGSLIAGAPDRAQALLDEAMPGLEDPLQRAMAQSLEAGVRFALGQGGETALILLEAARSMAPLDVTLARQTLLGALEAAVYIQPATTGPVLREIAGEAKAIPQPPESPPSAVDFLLDGYAALITAGYPSGVPLLKQAIPRMLTEGLDATDGLRWLGLVLLAAYDLFDDVAIHTLATRWVRLAREHAALTILPIALSYLGGAELTAGRLQECQALAEQSLEISASTGNPGMLGAAARGNAHLLAWRGNEAEARARAAAHMAYALERGQTSSVILAHYALTVLELGLGRYQAALENALPLYADDPPVAGSWVLPNLVEAAARSGHDSAAREALKRLAERAEASGTPLALGFLARARALVAGDAKAESLYEESIDQLGRSSAKPELARSHLLFGEWLRRQSRRRDARDQLRTAHDMFASMGLEAFAERARVELLATGERARKRTVETQAQLTPQETQIARLVREGARNQEIAAQLFISTSTVEYHLVRVFRKLGVTSRTQLARILVEQSHDGGSPSA